MSMMEPEAGLSQEQERMAPPGAAAAAQGGAPEVAPEGAPPPPEPAPSAPPQGQEFNDPSYSGPLMAGDSEQFRQHRMRLDQQMRENGGRLGRDGPRYGSVRESIHGEASRLSNSPEVSTRRILQEANRPSANGYPNPIFYTAAVDRVAAIRCKGKTPAQEKQKKGYDGDKKIAYEDFFQWGSRSGGEKKDVWFMTREEFRKRYGKCGYEKNSAA